MIKSKLTPAVCILVIGLNSVVGVPTKEAKLWEPVEWEFENPGWTGNPFDLVAKAGFTHEDTGESIETEPFYEAGDTWKLRFTSTRADRRNGARSVDRVRRHRRG